MKFGYLRGPTSNARSTGAQQSASPSVGRQLARTLAAIQEVTTRSVSFPSTNSQDALMEILRSGAQRLLAKAVPVIVDGMSDHSRRGTDRSRDGAKNFQGLSANS